MTTEEKKTETPKPKRKWGDGLKWNKGLGWDSGQKWGGVLPTPAPASSTEVNPCRLA